MTVCDLARVGPGQTGTDVSHVYAAAGTYTVRVTATDKDGATSGAVSHTIAIDVIEPTDLDNVISYLDQTGATEVVLSDVLPQNIKAFLEQIAALPARQPDDPVIEICLNLDHGTFGLGRPVDVPLGYTLVVNGVHQVIITGSSPALTLASGDLFVSGDVTFTNATDSATILVQSGSLALRGVTVEETTGGDRAAVEILGGIADLGTAGDPGSNTMIVNGDGEFLRSTGAGTVSAVGNTLRVGSTTFAADIRADAGMLEIVGTAEAEAIHFEPGFGTGEVELQLNGIPLGTFRPNDRLIAHGQQGDDTLQVAGSIQLAAWLYGDVGNDRLNRYNDDYFLRTEAEIAPDTEEILYPATVLEDDATDKLTGSAGMDWFFCDESRDRITDLHDEAYANELDWILAE